MLAFQNSGATVLTLFKSSQSSHSLPYHFEFLILRSPLIHPGYFRTPSAWWGRELSFDKHLLHSCDAFVECVVEFGHIVDWDTVGDNTVKESAIRR